MEKEYIEYYECPVMMKLKKSDVPMVAKVQTDEFTNMVQSNFDYEFNGISKFYPYEFPKELLNINFNIMVIVGASGRGKSTLLKELTSSGKIHLSNHKFFNDKSIVSCFNSPNEASEKLSAVGLNSMPVWCRPRNVLSVGEGFRADISLNLEDNIAFDEFTSTVDRNVAKSSCNGIQRYIRNKNLSHTVFVSCHKDFIPFLKPDIVIDLDDECVYDCRGKCLGKTLLSKCINVKTKTFGECLGIITI